MLKKAYVWFHRVTSRSDERGEYSSGVWQDQVRTRALELCRAQAGSVLEVGCGEGLFLTQLAAGNSNARIAGIDISKRLLDKAHDRLIKNGMHNVVLSHADGTLLPFKESSFDAVVCINVIFNLPSRDIVRKVFQEIARVSKKDGKIIFDFRNKRNPLLSLKYKFAPYYDQTVKDLPLKTYCLRDMRLLLDEAGFAVTRILYVGFFIKPISPLIMIEAKKK